jgi:DNA-binding HxlR family transcriptional regulator
MAIPQNHPPACPVEACLGLLSGRWKALLLWKLGRGGAMRFGALRRALPSASKKMLVQRLRELEKDGLVAREILAESPIAVAYALTARGASLTPILEASAAWTARDLAARAGQRAS